MDVAEPATPVIRGGAISAGKREGPREETSLLAFLSILLLHRRVIVLSALIGFAVLGVKSATSATMYVSRASYTVKSGAVPVQLPGMSAVIRALAAGSQFSQDVSFYADLVKAKAIIQPVAAKTYTTIEGERTSLAKLYGIEDDDKRILQEKVVQRVIDDVSSSIYSRSGVIGVAVQSTDPFVAQQLARNIVSEINTYGGARRQAQTVEERQFVEGLLGEARARLDRSEENLAAFMRNNREYNTAPALRLAFDRLTREVQLQQQLFVTLQNTYEQARIDEVREPTTITIVEPPDRPPEPERRAALRVSLLGMAGGALVGIIIAFIRQRLAESRLEATAGYLRLKDALSR